MKQKSALTALFCLIATADFAHAEKRPARKKGTTLSQGGMVLVGPRLAATRDGVAVAWIEEPKTLVVAELDAQGALTAKERIELAEPDAPVEQLAPLVHEDGSISVAILERGVRRLGAELPLRRLSVRHLSGLPRAVSVIAEAPDDGSGDAPAAIVAFGHYTTARLATVVWRRSRPEAATNELRAGTVTFSIIRGDGVTDSEVLGETRTATAISWKDDGGAVIAAAEAGRPLVVEPTGESPIDVPTPAVVSSVIAPPDGRAAWIGAGVDGGKRLFTVAAAVSRLPTRSFILPIAPLVDAPADLADAGKIVGLPSLVVRSDGVALVWPARVARRDELRVRALADDGLPTAASSTALACAAGEKILASDAIALPGGGVLVAATCAARGRANVRVGTIP